MDVDNCDELMGTCGSESVVGKGVLNMEFGDMVGIKRQNGRAHCGYARGGDQSIHSAKEIGG